jgi:hypothetical protein
MCPRTVWGKGLQSRNCYEDVKEWVPVSHTDTTMCDSLNF